jgi:cysteine-rich secretory family protein
MRFLCLVLAGVIAGSAAEPARLNGAEPQYDGGAPNQQAAAEQVFALANQARRQAGVGRLEWDPALAAAALKHCQRMAAEGPIAHRYGGEPDLSERAAQAGAHFSVIEENVAIAPTPDQVHEEWMHSPGHRQNLLSPDVDRIGVAVVAARGVLYAVADYSRAVQQMNASQVEARVAALVRPSGVSILQDPSVARAACATDSGMPRATGGMQPRFIMRWQDADLSRLPQELVEHLQTGRYRAADVGACPAQVAEGSFTAYRIAVILY